MFDEQATEQSQVWQRLQNSLPGIIRITDENLLLFGAPVSESAVTSLLEKKYFEMNRPMINPRQVEPHQALDSIRHCVSVAPKLTYFLRCSPAYKFPLILMAFDGLMRNCISNIGNVQFDERFWLQAALPVQKCGSGIRWMEELSLPAFSASAFFVSDMVLQICVYSWDETKAAAAGIWEALNGDLPPVQHQNVQQAWDAPYIERLFSQLFAMAD